MLQNLCLHGTGMYFSYITVSKNSTADLLKHSLYCTALRFRAGVKGLPLCRNMVVVCSLRKERSCKFNCVECS